jgi:hypothetical protein
LCCHGLVLHLQKSPPWQGNQESYNNNNNFAGKRILGMITGIFAAVTVPSQLEACWCK